MEIREVKDINEKQQITRTVLEALPDWFAVTESREEYIQKSADLLMFTAFDENDPVGFLCLKETGKDTMEICVMGVLRQYHRKGVGKRLFEKARAAAEKLGYSFLQVKTVQMGKYDDYDITNRFYQAMGFKEFELFPNYWDEDNPCQIYVMSLK